MFHAIRRYVLLSGVLVAFACSAFAQERAYAGAIDPSSQLSEAMATMHASLADFHPSGEVDSDFVRMMIPHHQAAIDMAKIELRSGKDPELRRLAQEIITDQQSEIDLLQRWLTQRPVAQSSAEPSPRKAKQ
jgi:uncharacterized protein (DUF305 family)